MNYRQNSAPRLDYLSHLEFGKLTFTRIEFAEFLGCGDASRFLRFGQEKTQITANENWTCEI